MSETASHEQLIRRLAQFIRTAERATPARGNSPERVIAEALLASDLINRVELEES